MSRLTVPLLLTLIVCAGIALVVWYYFDTLRSRAIDELLLDQSARLRMRSGGRLEEVTSTPAQTITIGMYRLGLDRQPLNTTTRRDRAVVLDLEGGGVLLAPVNEEAGIAADGEDCGDLVAAALVREYSRAELNALSQSQFERYRKGVAMRAVVSYYDRAPVVVRSPTAVVIVYSLARAGPGYAIASVFSRRSGRSGGFHVELADHDAALELAMTLARTIGFRDDPD